MKKRQSLAVMWISLSVISFFVFLFLSICVNTTGSCYNSANGIDTLFNVQSVSNPIASIALFFTYLGNAEVIQLIAICICAILILIHERYIAALCLLGLTIGGTSALNFKNIFARIRPTDYIYLMPRGGYSFPSGHALVSTVFYGFIGFCLIQLVTSKHAKIAIGLVTALLIYLIGISRIILHYHWPTDVLGGWILGFSILSLLNAAYSYNHIHWHKKRFNHGFSRAIIICLVLLTGFWVVGYYVTHPLVVRSTIL